ncbi:EF-P beta-lysylation protein EpmB [sulfur-oxidizing endosymbiont of Gigantopelta aegis]|uniref:EF-P beta-lysylation protein EpmB n=1 Tax=sulfur-oxidizing endosymbiont of Gigantopelta aegis TaxID=2794934 RepID=UPI002483609F|nr:EF-P beta-lysylation protein EpmB [sulfur-oxidizing endosymbiont of Gigantopelta aegis]
MIPRKSIGNQTRKYFTKPLELLEHLNLSPEALQFSEAAAQDFHFKVPLAYVNKIQSGDPTDPLLLQILPVQAELNSHPDYVRDPLAEANSLFQPGLLQKYHGRALLLVTPSCAINCRYCFRRHYPYEDKGYLAKQMHKNIQLIQQDDSISEVILSGGDPLSLSDARLAELIAQLETIPHLQRLRIHTRFPVVEPQRVTAKLLQLLSSTRLSVIMVLHINHAQEIATDTAAALKKLQEQQIILFNQSVLLKGVNDDVQVLKTLSETLIKHHIVPYYLHMLDHVQGSAHFEISDAVAIRLHQQLREILPGYMLPRLVREVAGEKSKLDIFTESIQQTKPV